MTSQKAVDEDAKRPAHAPGDPAPSEEWVPEDDAIIGKAFKWSLGVIVGLGLSIALFVFLFNDSGAEETIIDKDAGLIEDRVTDVTELPEVKFSDRTVDSGIEFVHENGARGDKLLPETMGSGVAVFDFNQDGDQDLLFVNSKTWPHDPETVRATAALYDNDGTGRFRDVAAEVGLDVTLYGMGVAVADFDGTGTPDVFLTAVGKNRLFQNVGGRFEDVTEAAGVAGDKDEWSSSAGFFDYDNDGDLDLFVCNYVRWSREIDEQLNFTLNGTDRAYGPPTNYTGTYPSLYRNEGDGTFTDVSTEVHVDNPVTGQPMAKSLGVSFVDVDQDGFQDIIVANDTVQNFLYHNEGNGKFEEIGMESGLGMDSEGSATGAMGIDAAHFRNDECIGIGIGNFANEMTSFYVSQRQAMFFSDDAIGEGIGSPSRQRLTFGVFFFDYDLDGRLDFLQTNGHLEETINEIQPSQHYLQPAQLFWNAGPDEFSCYREVPPSTAGDLARPIAGRGAAFGDLDGDGDQDVVLTQVGGRPLLLENDQDLDHHWLRIRLVGRGMNQHALGAWVELEANGTVQRRSVSPTRSYLSQSELPVTFGLGDAESIESLHVVWPDGTRQEFPPPDQVDTTITLERQ